ncbi:hypothetical protein A0H81_13300 [Grifola frondosa]|uniref:Uncharacterized protein n=1 Tax=Grifola frondosa TaxID=5627 RepID=A0A1C7LVX7_GRIFR|nr:hypothetical protein A0H81_13300 [Grifola frondosa]
MTSLPSSTVPQADTTIDDVIADFSNLNIERDYKRLARNYDDYKMELELDVRNVNAPLRFLSYARNELANMQQVPTPLLRALWKNGQRRSTPLQPRSQAELCERMVKHGPMGFLLDACIPLSQGEKDSSIDSPDEQAAYLDREFNRIYQGTAVSDFKSGLMDYEQMYDSQRHYGRTIPIVQSSGTGKSRLVKELGDEFPTLSVCFRPTVDMTSGWPPNDTPAREFFNRTGMTSMGEELAAAFLGAWLEVALSDITDRGNLDKPVHERLHGWRIMAQRNGGDSRHDRERGTLESIRQNIMSSVADSATADKERTTSDTYAKDSFDPDLVAKGPPTQEEIEAQEQEQISILTWHEELFTLLVKPSFDQLAEILAANNVNTFLVAFDECTQLDIIKKSPNIRRSTPPQWGMSLIALQRILKATDEFALPGVRFWFLLLDTNSSVTDLAPVGPNVPSYRLRSGFVPLPVWSCLGFDQLKPKRNDLPQTPQGAHFLEHLRRYGRPYWSTLELKHYLLQGAQQKLMSSPDGFNPLDINHVFALFSHRVLLEVGSGPASSRLMAEAVRSHMRLLMGVRAGSMVITKAASEPMLAIAAAVLLNDPARPIFYESAMQTLIEKLVEQGLVLDRGLQGELSGRLLLTLARDKAIRAGHNFVMKQRGALSIVPVTVADFLSTLVGRSVLSKRLLEDNEDVWVNFTHFIQVEKEISTIDVEDLYDAWCRTAAIQCTLGQPIIDNLIVTYRGDLDAPVVKKNLGYIVVQEKARGDPVSSKTADALVGPYILAKDVDGFTFRYKPKGHVAIMMDLGAKSTFARTSRRVKLTYGKAERGDKGHTWSGYATNAKDEAERYCLNVRGHDAQVYPVVEPFEKVFDKLFDRVLACEQEPFQKYADKMVVATDVLPLAQTDEEEDKED